MLKIWQFDPAQTTAYYNTALCNALSEAGCQVHYVTSPYLYEESLPLSANVQADYFYKLIFSHRLLRQSRWLRRGARAATYPLGHWWTMRAAEASPPDIIHIQWGRWPLIDQWLIRHFRAMQIPVIYTVHDVVPIFDPHSRHRYEEIYSSVDRLIVLTHSALDAFQHEFPTITWDKVSLIPLIGAPNQTTPANASRSIARQKLKLPEDAQVLLFFGTIRPYKGIAKLVEAYQLLAPSNPNLWLVIAGQAESPQEAYPLQSLQGHPRVLLHNTFIPYASMWHYFLAADVVVYPYEQIYQSAALVDAMGFGCPVIVTNVGGLAGNCGWKWLGRLQRGCSGNGTDDQRCPLRSTSIAPDE